MKKLSLSFIALFAIALAMMAFTNPSGKASRENSNPPQEQVAPVFPDEVQKILETSCFDCHTDAASNVKSKSKLNFSKWSELSDAKKIGKMEDMNEEVTESNMPPEKYLEKYPEKALKQEHKEIISKWVNETSSKLMGE